MSWCRTSIDVGEAHWHFLFKHLRGPTCSTRVAGFPLFLFLLTLRNISVNKLPVLSSHAPHLIRDTCLSKTERETDQDRTFQEFLSVVTQKYITCNVRKLFFKGDRYICSHSIRYIFHQKNKVMNLTYHFFFSEQKFLGKTHSFRVG